MSKILGVGSPKGGVGKTTTAVILATTQAAAAATPARVPLAEVDPDARLLDEERKLVTHAVRIAAYNTESALARLLRPRVRHRSTQLPAHPRPEHVSSDHQVAPNTSQRQPPHVRGHAGHGPHMTR